MLSWTRRLLRFTVNLLVASSLVSTTNPAARMMTFLIHITMYYVAIVEDDAYHIVDS